MNRRNNETLQVRSLRSLSAIVFFFLLAANVGAQDDFPQFKLRMLLDGRIVFSDQEESWLDGSFGKSRYGGDGENSKTTARLAQVSILFSTSLTEAFTARAHLNIDAEPDRELDRSRIDIVEIFAAYRFVPTPSQRIRIRTGIFIPPVSLENTDPAWTSPYTVTSSAINSWIGEEVRTTGAEASWIWSAEGNELAARGAIFWQNDPAASLLAWRGWSLQDRQSGFNDKLPLPPIPALSSTGLFPKQPLFVEPFREVDRRPGYYGGFTYTRRDLDFSALFYDNRGDPKYFDGTQYAWQTNFLNIGFHVRLPMNSEFLGQYMKGNSVMGLGNMVDIDFASWFLLATTEHKSHRWSFRFDRFEVEDRDRYLLKDDNNEEGWATVGAWIWKFKEKYRVAIEYMRIHNERPARANLNLPIESNENIVQGSFRIIIGN